MSNNGKMLSNNNFRINFNSSWSKGFQSSKNSSEVCLIRNCFKISAVFRTTLSTACSCCLDMYLFNGKLTWIEFELNV